MRFISSIELGNYLNIKHARLDDLKDLNIIIGPNNCGKTSLLGAINLLSRISFDRYGRILCNICKNAFKDERIQDISGSINANERYLRKISPEATFGFNMSEIEKVLPELSKRYDALLTRTDFDEGARSHLREEFDAQRLVIKEKEQGLVLEHFSPIAWAEVTRTIFSNILSCPDERLQTYKGTQIPEHVKSKNFETDENVRLIQFLRQAVDPKLASIRQSLELVRNLENERFNTSIAEQGSGVKSLICLIADMIHATQTRILLVDEPELGLNPSGKHEFLKFLIEQTQNRQIFLATHDPTFVNPILWNRENVSVYLYSIIDEKFVKVDLAQSKDDPNTFAGYLPHTTSLKQMHIYVEGTNDAYIFQVFLDRYVHERFKEDWYRVLSKIGIYHLAGDFWSHLLYTIPKSPYASIVILDGDKIATKEKRNVLEEIIKKYSKIEKDRFRMLDLQDIRNLKQDEPNISCPIYCLKLPEIEDYLDPRPTSKERGPIVAYNMEHIPQEIVQLFEAVFQMADIK